MHRKINIEMNRILLVVLIVSILINIAAISLLSIDKGDITTAYNFSALEKQYPLLSKRILQEFPQDILMNFLDLRKNLKQMVSLYDNNFGLYFEYLPTGTSININGNNEIYAASLFKSGAWRA